MLKKIRIILLSFCAFMTLAQSGIAQVQTNHPSIEIETLQGMESYPNTDKTIVGLDTQFGGTELPSNWQMNELGDPGHGWNLLGNMIWINSFQNEGFHVAGELISPAIDCSQMEVVLLGMNLHYYYYPLPAGMTDAEIRYSTDGVNWSTFYTFTKSIGGSPNKYFEWDLTSIAAGEEEFYLKFWFDDQDILRAYWQINSVTVYAPTEPQFSVVPSNETIEFPYILIEESSEPQTITITNIGIGHLIVQVPIIEDNTHFSLQYDANSFPASLAFHESVSFEVVFNPQMGGQLETSLTLNYTEVVSGEYSFTLMGEGVDPLVNEFPWSESFNKIDFPPLGWKFINGVPGASWQGSGVESYEGSRAARAYYGPSSNYKANEWLISPPLDLSQPGAELLSFYTIANFESDSITDKIQVWLIPDKYDNVEDLEAHGQMIGEVYVDEVWERKSFDIREYIGLQYLAFRYYVNHTKGWRHVYVDLVQIDELEVFTLNVLEPVGVEGKTSPEPGEHSYYALEEAYLRADADYAWGWKFEKWEVDGTFYSDEPQVNLLMDGNKTAQAFFSPVPPLTIEMLYSSGQGTTLPANGVHQYKQGAMLSIEAFPESGWEFSHWEKNGTQFSNDNPSIVSVEDADTYKAIFVEGQTNNITFQIQDNQGNPISNAQIRLNEIDNPIGNYTFNNLYPGQYHYSIVAQDYIPDGGDLILSYENTNETVLLVLSGEETFDFTFEIVTTTGTPINDATIILNGYANPQGNYLFTGFPADDYDVRILSDSYQTYESVVSINEEELSKTVVLDNNSRLWYEDFNRNILPGGWSIVVHGDANHSWLIKDETAVIEPHPDFFVSASLVSPAIPVADAGALGIRMHHFYSPYVKTNGEIRISNDGLTWHTAKAFKDNSEGDFLEMEELNYYLTEYFSFDEKVYIAFYYSALNSIGSFYTWTIDDIEVYEPKPYTFDSERMNNHFYLEEGETGNHRLRIKNFGGLEDTFSLEQVTGQWTYDFPSSINLVAGKQVIIDIPFTVPTNLNMGTRDSLTIRITSLGEPSLTADVLFICGTISTIKEDYKEDFDIAIIPNLPGGWSSIKNANTSHAFLGTAGSAYSPISKPNVLRLHNSTDAQAELVLISPPIDDSKSLSEFRTRFWIKNSKNLLVVGTMDSPNGTFTPLGEFVSDNHFTWKEFMLGFEDYIGTDKYVAFKQQTEEPSSQIVLEDIFIELITPPRFNISQPSHTFPEGWLSYPNDSIEVTITNKGHYSLVVSDIGLEQNEDFMIIAPPLPVSLQYNEPLVVKIIFNPQKLGEVTDNMIVTYTENVQSQYSFALSGSAIPRPQGSTCANPIPVELPLIDFQGNTQQYGNDYRPYYVTPYNIYLNGDDMVMQFTLEKASLLSGSISGSQAGFFILKTCPDPDNPAQVMAGAFNVPGYQEFEHVSLNAGSYFLIVSSSRTKPPFYTDFTVNLSAIPLPNAHKVTFLVTEDSAEQVPLGNVSITLMSELMNKTLKTNSSGRVTSNLFEGEYTGTVFLFNYLEQTIGFEVIGDIDEIHIPLKDLIFNPTGLAIDTENQNPGRALFRWDAKPKGEPWFEGFEGGFLPNGWEQIITNTGGLVPEEDGADWQFTWQQYGTINFSDASVKPHGGAKQAFVHWSPYPQDEWLISHEFTAPADDVKFWYYGKNGDSNQHFYLKISNDNGENWTTLWDATDLPLGYNHYTNPAVVNLSYYANQNVRLAWNAVGQNGLISAFMLDDISVGDMRIDTEDLTPLSKTQQGKANGVYSPLATSSNISSTKDNAIAPMVNPEVMSTTPGGSGAKTFIGFDIYLDDMTTPIATGIHEPQYLYKGLYEGDYLAGVRTKYSTGDSELATIGFTITQSTTSIDGGNEMLTAPKVYPNPASNWIMAESNERISHVTLYNSLGEIIISQPANNNLVRLSIGHLPSGIYLMHVTTGTNRHTSRVMIAK